MPYIPKSRREQLEDGGDYPSSPGELNYVITRLCVDYLKHYPPSNYSRYNEVMGVLECAKLELYRRMVAEYEDGACQRNGEVYE